MQKMREEAQQSTSQQTTGDDSGALAAALQAEAEERRNALLQQREQDRMAELDSVRQFLGVETQAMFEAYTRRAEILQQATDDGLISQQRNNELRLQLHQKMEHELTRITERETDARTKFEKMSAADKTRTVLAETISMTQGVAQHSRTMFRINKAAAIGQAIMDTNAAFNRTLREYPYPVNIALAALTAAAGIARVNAIRQQQFGGGTTPSSAGSAPVINNNPVAPTPSPTEERPEAQAGAGGAVRIYLLGGTREQDVAPLLEQFADHMRDTGAVLIQDNTEQAEVIREMVGNV